MVFIDETWTKTNMAPLRGWGPRGERLSAKVPYGHWNTMTFIAALRHDRIEAPLRCRRCRHHSVGSRYARWLRHRLLRSRIAKRRWLLDRPINADRFQTYVENVLVPTLLPMTW